MKTHDSFLRERFSLYTKIALKQIQRGLGKDLKPSYEAEGTLVSKVPQISEWKFLFGSLLHQTLVIITGLGIPCGVTTVSSRYLGFTMLGESHTRYSREVVGFNRVCSSPSRSLVRRRRQYVCLPVTELIKYPLGHRKLFCSLCCWTCIWNGNG